MKKLKAKKNAVFVHKGSARGLSVKRFTLTYVLLMGAFFFIIGYAPLKDIIDVNGSYTRGVVIVTSKVLDALRVSSTYQGSIIKLPSISLDVQFGCNGLEAVLIFAVAVIAYPAAWKTRFLGIGAGFVIIQVINIMRIAGLAYSGVYYRKLFDVIHIYVAQGIMIAVALGLFLLYLRYTGRQHANVI